MQLQRHTVHSLMAQYLLAIKFAQVRGKVTEAEARQKCFSDLKKLPDQVEMLTKP